MQGGAAKKPATAIAKRENWTIKSGDHTYDGMEIWDNGDPPQKFKVLGIIDDERLEGVIPMSQLRGDMAKKAREAGRDAVVQLSSQSQIAGYYTAEAKKRKYRKGSLFASNATNRYRHLSRSCPLECKVKK